MKICKICMRLNTSLIEQNCRKSCFHFYELTFNKHECVLEGEIRKYLPNKNHQIFSAGSDLTLIHNHIKAVVGCESLQSAKTSISQ